MKREDVEKIFNKIRDCLEYHFSNAEDKEDLIERLNTSLNEMEEEFINEEG